MASELGVGVVKAATAELNATDYHLKLQDGAGNPWYLRAPDGSLRMHLNGTGDVLNFDGTGNITQLGGSPEYHFGTTSASHYNWRIACQESIDGAFEIASGTTSAGSNAPNDTYTTRFHIAGATGLATFSGGIAFSQTNTSATGAAVDTNGTILDHYEEGTFTYTITGSSVAGTHSAVLRQGNYTRVGNICTVMGYYYGTSGTGSGEMIIGGLPFPVKSGAAPVGSIQANSGLVIASGSNPTVISAGSSTFKVRCTKEDGSAFTYAPYPTDPGYIRFGVTYVI